ncbi:GNAT family N-acetyltransferase [Pontibacterium sp.]|uniref:GNAT family N-acetyltransferase n=1 Tax=Pontibacterium sp. TaxID=2036026 RepID=UPI00356800D3
MNHTDNIRSELRYLVREIGLLDKNCLNSGLSLTQAHLLTYLERNGETVFTELCQQLNVDKAALSRTLKGLVEKKWIASREGVENRKQRWFSIQIKGIEQLQYANNAANKTFTELLAPLAEGECQTVLSGLRLLRLSAFRKRYREAPEQIRFESLRNCYRAEADQLLRNIFNQEQGIPANLIPLNDTSNTHWWCARSGEYIIGVVAAWKMGSHWHWGRFAVDDRFRGLGVGKRLALYSLDELFKIQSGAVLIDARDTAVRILEPLGAKVKGSSENFYGMPVTTMRLNQDDFIGTDGDCR